MKNEINTLTTILLDLLADLEANATEASVIIKAEESHVIASLLYEKLKEKKDY